VTPRVSVVMATHDRPRTLASQLDALRGQTLPDDDYEIVVVDDASGPETTRLLAAVREQAGPALHVLRRETSGGPARARNLGWRTARAPLIAFTDDDCRVAPGWLGAGLAAWDGNPRRFVQGPTRPDPGQAHLLGHFAHTLRVERLGPWFETANVFYPRAALEEADGFDEERYSGLGGEDTDLARRLIAAGFEPVWAEDALVHHEVQLLTRREKLRLAWRWDQTMRLFKEHPQLRANLTARVFWLPEHWQLVKAALALALPRRLWPVRWWLAAPYFARVGTLRPDVVAFLVVHDLVEMGACARGGLRYRTPVL
jgi:GT2 family glycosyltransferase